MSLSNAAGYGHGIIGGHGGKLGLLDGFAGVDGGYAGMVQSSPDQDDADEGQDHRSGGGYEHPKGPTSHALLGAQIGLIASALLLNCYLVFLGYKLANSGLDAFDSRQKGRGAVLFGSGVMLACGSSFLLAGGFWFALGGGLLRLLS